MGNTYIDVPKGILNVIKIYFIKVPDFERIQKLVQQQKE